MTAGSQTTLGDQVASYPPKGGFTEFQNRAPVRNALIAFAGAVVGLIPGLFVALFTDFWPALIIGALVGGIAGFTWARRLNFDAAVTEARVHEGGVVLIDARGTHTVSWSDVASIEGRHIENVLGTGKFGVGDIKGVTEHNYVLRVRDGTGYWLDDRVTNVAELVASIARSAGVAVVPMR